MATRQKRRSTRRSSRVTSSPSTPNSLTPQGGAFSQLISSLIGQHFTPVVVRLRLLWIILVAFLFLTGCVQYEVGIQFRDANHGAIVQQIQLSEQLTGVSQATANLWLDQLTMQAKQLGGKVQHRSDRRLALQIPFFNAQDLVTKFDRFFQTVTNPAWFNSSAAPVPAVNRRNLVQSSTLSKLRLQTRNRIFWQRYHLIYDLDLRSLQIVPGSENAATVLINPKSLLGLNLTLSASGGIKPVTSPIIAAQPPLQVGQLDMKQPDLEQPNLEQPDLEQPDLSTPAPSVWLPPAQVGEHQISWNLRPGEVNHLEAIFWVPSPIGIGLAIIVVFVLGGMLLKAWQDPNSLIDLPPEIPPG